MYINQKKSNSKSNMYHNNIMHTLTKDQAKSNNNYNNKHYLKMNSHNHSQNLLYLIKNFMIQYGN